MQISSLSTKIVFLPENDSNKILNSFWKTFKKQVQTIHSLKNVYEKILIKIEKEKIPNKLHEKLIDIPFNKKLYFADHNASLC